VPPPPPDPVERLVATGGKWEPDFDYYYFGTISEGPSQGRYRYGLVPKGSTDRFNGSVSRDVEYDPGNKKDL